MAVEVLENNVAKYIVTCMNCNSKLRYTAKDTELISNYINDKDKESFREIRCPACGACVRVTNVVINYFQIGATEMIFANE